MTLTWPGRARSGRANLDEYENDYLMGLDAFARGSSYVSSGTSRVPAE